MVVHVAPGVRQAFNHFKVVTSLTVSALSECHRVSKANPSIVHSIEALKQTKAPPTHLHELAIWRLNSPFVGRIKRRHFPRHDVPSITVVWKSGNQETTNVSNRRLGTRTAEGSGTGIKKQLHCGHGVTTDFVTRNGFSGIKQVREFEEFWHVATCCKKITSVHGVAEGTLACVVAHLEEIIDIRHGRITTALVFRPCAKSL
jgi:hypothetical protein